jgi:hypothetical protein
MSEPSSESRAKRRGIATVACALSLAWSIAWVAASDRFGPTWDAASVEYPLGERALAFVLGRPVAGGDPSRAGTYEEHLEAKERPGPRVDPEPRFDPPIAVDTTWPLSPILCAASYETLHARWKLLPPFPAWHAPVGLAAALLVLALAHYAGRRLGVVAAIAAPASLLFAPRFCADAMNNMKDVPEAALYFAATWAWASAFRRGEIRRYALAGAFVGAALAQKANALFLGPHVVVLLLVAAALRDLALPSRGKAAFLLRAVGVSIAAFVATYVALSPQLWEEPLKRLSAHYAHVFSTGNAFVSGVEHRKEASFEAAFLAYATTPPSLLALAALGLFAKGLRRGDRAFLAVGALFPIARTTLPGMTNYDGVRHFLEFYPPLCVLAAAGVAALARFLVARVSRGEAVVAAGVLATALLPSFVALMTVMPDGTAYYSDLSGGIRGARARGDPDATDYWANSYWRAFDQLNAKADFGARVFAPVAPKVLSCAAPVRARPDLVVEPPDKVAREAPGERAVYVVYVTREAWYPGVLRNADATRTPDFTIDVDGVPVLKVLRFAPGDEAAAATTAMIGIRAGLRGRSRLEKWVDGRRDRIQACLDVLTNLDVDRGLALRNLVGRPNDRDIDAFVNFVWF